MSNVVLFWIWVCAYLNCAGWALSALHQLNARGYAVTLALGFVALLAWRKHNAPQIFPEIHWQPYARRFRRPFPLAFLILSLLAFLGGLLHAPTNYDALAYRVPRVLHWLAADQWHWIHTIFPRVNNRSCGIEWVSAPLIALLKTDRWVFLINTLSFLLLPGLVFSVFTRLGVRRRVAWRWMWLAPTGYCFVLQAGSIGNDLFGAVFALAAVDFALRAKTSNSPRDFFAAILAAALMTSAKTASLPLLLPVTIALLPSLKIILRAPARTLAVVLVAIFASALPTMVLNTKYSGEWSGAEKAPGQEKGAALLRTAVNTGLIVVDNFTPPVFPLAKSWDRAVTNRMPAELTARLGRVMVEPAAVNFPVQELQMEESAGIGFGVSALLLGSVLAAGLTREKRIPAAGTAWQAAVRWAPAISLLAVMTQSNLMGLARILTPYYLLLLPAALAGAGQAWVIQRRWWRAAAFLVFFMAAGLLIVSPARPLFPAGMVLEQLAHNSQASLFERLKTVYSVYASRNDAFAPARAALPPALTILGLVTFDDPEASLWRPFGSRRIAHVRPDDTAAELKARGITHVLMNREDFEKWFGVPLDVWLTRMNGTVIQTIPLNLRAAVGPRDWCLVKLD